MGPDKKNSPTNHDAHSGRLTKSSAPVDKIKLQVEALTGTRFNTETMEVEVLEPEEWYRVKAQYMEFARKHSKTCKYPKANVFRKLFPKESEKRK